MAYPLSAPITTSAWVRVAISTKHSHRTSLGSSLLREPDWIRRYLMNPGKSRNKCPTSRCDASCGMPSIYSSSGPAAALPNIPNPPRPPPPRAAPNPDIIPIPPAFPIMGFIIGGSAGGRTGGLGPLSGRRRFPPSAPPIGFELENRIRQDFSPSAWSLQSLASSIDSNSTNPTVLPFLSLRMRAAVQPR